MAWFGKCCMLLKIISFVWLTTTTLTPVTCRATTNGALNLDELDTLEGVQFNVTDYDYPADTELRAFIAMRLRLLDGNRAKRQVDQKSDTNFHVAPGNSIEVDGSSKDGLGKVAAAVAAPVPSDEELRINGFRVEESEKHLETAEGGVPSVHSSSSVLLRLFGTGLTPRTVIIFTHEPQRFGGPCQVPVTEKFRLKHADPGGKSGLVEVELPDVVKNKKYFYLCAKYEDSDPLSSSEQLVQQQPFLHQGAEPYMRLTSYKPFLPLWISCVIIIVCLTFSALFSGLNLGLMSLDRTDLKILCNTGTEKEKRYAKAIQPVRDHGNYLLCSILLGNVLVNSTFTILLDSLTSGLIAIVFSTIAIVIFGEITPQAICSRHGLAVGAKTIIITKCVMGITFPLSYPTSKILDWLLGKEIGNFYDRDRLKELVKVTNDVNDLDKDEVNVISGVLELRKKTVAEVMTRLEDCFMLDLETTLDFETITEIMKTGFSRIPVFEEDRDNIVSILHIKDLAFVDPEENTPLRRLCEFYRNPLYFVFYDQTLDVMFREFKSGKIGHMAFIQSVNSEGEGDPFYETLGLITLEDVIEELIQAEIVDETDVYTDNRRKVRRERIKRQDFTLFAQDRDPNAQRLRIAPNLKLATFQYLSTAVQPFRSDCISEAVLRRLLTQNIVHQIKFKNVDKNDPRYSIITRGTQVDYFVLILEGRVEVTVGKENLLFESGPFTYFGIQALTQNLGYEVAVETPQQVMGSLQSLNRDAQMRHTFIPDYTVKAVTDLLYIQISRNLYLAAKRATLMERSQKLGDQSMDPIDAEVEKLLNSLDDNDHNSVTPDMTNLTVHSGTKASISSSIAPSPTTALNEHSNNVNSSVSRNLTVLAHVHSAASSVAAVTENNIAPACSSGATSGGVGAGETRTDSDPSSAPLLPKP
ncbi:unextended protein [Anopheles coustani]|uniref:unextended protein n=1 Tax=Anopheles coustani TaxID=139045 RepID=UPI0026586E5E|nr:unextended protein [Anopheles coustani]